MQIPKQAVLLRIFIGENDRCGDTERRRPCPGPAHEGGTLACKVPQTADFVRSRRSEVCALYGSKCSQIAAGIELRVSEPTASLLDL